MLELLIREAIIMLTYIVLSLADEHAKELLRGRKHGLGMRR